MTRKKRRAREAREMFEGMGDEGDDDGPEYQPESSMMKAVREHKRDVHEKERNRGNSSIHDEDVERAARKKRKGRVGSDALGDSGLFAEERVAYAPKNTKGGEERAKSTYDFRGFDPDKAGKKKPKMKAH